MVFIITVEKKFASLEVFSLHFIELTINWESNNKWQIQKLFLSLEKILAGIETFCERLNIFIC